MKYVTVRPALVFLCLLLLIAAPGCRRQARGKPADPAQGRDALKTALEAWKKGDSVESLASAIPSITVADQRWQDRYKLVRYELADDDKVVGYDLQCRTTLWLKSPDGKEFQEKAVFSVSTNPRLVVVRAEG
jgi:hypothetical protein